MYDSKVYKGKICNYSQKLCIFTGHCKFQVSQASTGSSPDSFALGAIGKAIFSAKIQSFLTWLSVYRVGFKE